MTHDHLFLIVHILLFYMACLAYLLLFFCLNQNALLLEQLGQLSALMHRHQDVAAADKLLIDVQLRNGWPV